MLLFRLVADFARLQGFGPQFPRSLPAARGTATGVRKAL